MELLRRALPQRVLLFLLGVLGIFLGVKLATLHLGLIPPLDLSFLGTAVALGPTDQVGAALLGIAILLLGGITLLVLSLAGLAQPDRQFVLKVHGESGERARGELRVAERGLLKMLAWTAEDIQGVNTVEPRLKLGRDGWEVRCTVALLHDAVIAEVSEELRRTLRHALERQTGLQVGRVDILVQHAPDSPRVA